MESSFVLVLTVLITTLLDRASSQAMIASENPVPVGNDVTLHINTAVSEGIWLFKGTLIIVLISAGNGQIFDPWNARAEYNPSTSSLTLRSVTLEDSGPYSFYAMPNHRADLTLSVQVPVSNVSLRANAIDLVEHNDTAVLTCSVSQGTSLSYKWLKDDSMVTAGGNVELSDGNATLTINKMNRIDEGSFTCNVSNGLNYEASQPVHLNIRFGPLDVTISGPKSVTDNSSVTLNCSAVSRPESTYHWYFGNHSNPISNESVVTFTATNQHEGSYICEARNPVTNITKSETHLFTLAMGPLNVSIAGPDSAYENSAVTLSCSAVSQPESTYRWYLDEYFNPISNGSVLTFFAQQNGSYICEARNPVTNITMSGTHMFTIDTSIVHLPSQARVMLTTLFGLSATRLFY